jgi:hypothetical protein
MRFKSIKQVWQAIEQGKTVYWHNTGYALTIEPASKHTDSFSVKGEQCLRVTCLSNYFGSIIVPNDLKDLFIEGV